MADLRTVGHLFHNLMDSIEERGTTIEDQTIGIGDMTEGVFRRAMRTSNRCVHTAVGIFLGSHDIGWHIARERGAGLYHGSPSNTCIGIRNDRRGENYIVLYHAIAGNLRSIAKDTAIAHLGVVGDVSTFHEHIVIAEHRPSSAMGSTVNHHVLADNVVIADDTLRLFATELEILRQSTDNTALVDFIMSPHARTVHNTDKRKNNTVVTNYHVVLDIDEGENLAVIADFRLWRYLGSWTYFTCHYVLFFKLST